MDEKKNMLFKSDEDVMHYISQTIKGYSNKEDLVCKEIGDGNLNFIYRVKNKITGESIIVKQAGDFARTTQDYKLTIDRNRIEADVLKYYGEIAPNLVPKVYLFDDEKNCYIMEDLCNYEILRKMLMKHETNDKLSDQITTFLVNMLILTSDISMEHIQKKNMVKNYTNPELCKISEDLVFSDPYKNIGGTNNVFELNQEFVQHEIYSDEKLHLEVAKLKFEFMNKTEALIHGDLHTGSIFINDEGIKVIDPEFAFYGPAGYDIGNVIGNLLFAWANAFVTMDQGIKRKKYISWLENVIVEVIDMFKEKFTKTFLEKVNDEMANTKGFCEWYLSTVLSDTAAFSGLEMIRRVIGEAGVEDIQSIKNKDERCKAERMIIVLGKTFIFKKEHFKNGADYLSALYDMVKSDNY